MIRRLERRSGRWSGCAASAATSTTGTTCATCGCSSRRTSRTVDSGNLAGHLIALRQACLALADEPVFDARDLAGARHRRSRWRTSGCATPAGTEPRRSSSLRAGRARRSQLARRSAVDAPRRSRAVARAARERRGRAGGGRRSRARGAGAGGRVDRLEPAPGWRAIASCRRLGAARGRSRARAELRRDRRPTAAELRQPARGARRPGATLRDGDGLPASCSTRERKLFAIGYQQAHPLARRLVLRPARLRGAAGELHGDRQERRAGGALVPAGPHADPRRRARRRWCRGAGACSST